jgi:pyruvate/2-oxoglutarate/acetoin dehydrogenase E1 component
MTFSFSLVAFDQVVNNAPNMFMMSGGQFNIPITFRGPNGPRISLERPTRTPQRIFMPVCPA